MDGSALPRFKLAYITALQARANNVLYASPMQARDLQGETGTFVSAWFDDDAEANAEVHVFSGTPLIVDETFTVTLKIQACGITTDDTQYACDVKAVTLLGEAIGVLSTNPSLSIATDADLQMFAAVPAGWTYTSGVLPTNQRAAGFDLRIEVTARLLLQ